MKVKQRKPAVLQPVMEPVRSVVEQAMFLRSDLDYETAHMLWRSCCTVVMTTFKKYNWIMHPYDIATNVDAVSAMFIEHDAGHAPARQIAIAKRLREAVKPEVMRIDAAGYDRNRQIGDCLPDYGLPIGIIFEEPMGSRDEWLRRLVLLWRDYEANCRDHVYGDPPKE